MKHEGKVEHKKCFELPPPRKKNTGHESYTLVGQGPPTAFFWMNFHHLLTNKKRKKQDTVTAGT